MNALSLPTWIIHVSSVLEWMAAIWFVWLFALRDPAPRMAMAGDRNAACPDQRHGGLHLALV